jgi:ABC-type Zn uptake system ZnuABC Zn-binding protein ZnuA
MSRLRFLGLRAGLVAAALLLAACGGALEPTPTPAQPTAIATAAEAAQLTAPTPTLETISVPKLNVVATFSVLADLVRNVAGDKVELVVLVDRDTDAHEYEPSPSDAAKLANAQLIFENGLMFETWLDRLYESSGSTARRVVVSEGIQPRPHTHAHDESEHAHDHGKEKAHDHSHDHGKEKAHDHSHEKEAGHEHGEFDPHVWLDVRNAIEMVRNIAQALSDADPANAEFYEANAQAYIAVLEALDEEIVSLVEQIPEEARLLVTPHESLGYFADRYGFKLIGSLLGGMDREPSAQDIAKLVEEIKAKGVKAIFPENIVNPQIFDRIAQEAGVKIGPRLFTDALGAPDSPGATYVDMMRYNVRSIVEALR